MTDLETLRRALRASDGLPARPMGVDAILVRGRRLRRRRRLAIAGAALCAAGACLGTTVGLSHLTSTPSVRVQHPSSHITRAFHPMPTPSGPGVPRPSPSGSIGQASP